MSRFILACLLGILLVGASPIAAQPTEPAQQDSQAKNSEPEGIIFDDPQTIRWEFGVEIVASADGRGLSAHVPIPIDWPEQKVKSIELVKSPHISKVSYKDLNGLAKLMQIKINAMRGGETARAVVRMEIEKSHIFPPKDTTHFVFAEKLSSKLRKYTLPSPYIESRHRRIREVAESIDIDPQADAWTQVETIYQWVRDNVDYKFDEEIQTCLHALKQGHGDCEELTSIFIAICRAKGIPARAVWIPHHTYPEFYLEDAQGKGHWFPCQAAGTYEFGSMTDLSPILQKGDNFRVPGHRKAIRYVQPTLKATRFDGPPTFKWVMHDLEKKNDPNRYLQGNGSSK